MESVVDIVKKILRKYGLEVMTMLDAQIVSNKVKLKNYCLIRFRDRSNNKNRKFNKKLLNNKPKIQICKIKIHICIIVHFVATLQNGKPKNRKIKIKQNFHNVKSV